ncbi:MAG: helix-hairpin-helix domain-containing protein [Ignavibacteria bacterium]|nr:helix-hairpin-helix domain-containing protein [Ignavibacteria bacterium]
MTGKLIPVSICIYALMNCLTISALPAQDKGQTLDTTDMRNSYREEILMESFDTDTEDPDILEDLETLRRNPLDLNKVTFDELALIPFLNSMTARNILNYRSEIKKFKSKRELLKVKGMSAELYEKIKIYLIVRKSSSDVIIDETGLIYKSSQLKILDNITTRVRSRFMQDLQTKHGYLTDKYEGTKPKLYTGLKLKYGKAGSTLEINLTMEKDPGEKHLNDFTSGYFAAEKLFGFRKIIAGDYSLNFGQGLTLSGSGYFSKGIDAVSPLKRKGKGIKGYTSVSESQFFRGAAISYELGNFVTDLFYSDNYFDASIDAHSGNVSSFYNDGYHRTSSEIGRKKSVKEKFFGGRVSYSKGFLRSGITYWSGKFSIPVLKDTIKELYNFSGNKSESIGADYDVLVKNLNFFGEWTHSASGAVASINSVSFTFPGTAELIFSYRNYPYNFISVHSSGFGERSGETRNERGFYAGLTLKPFKGLTLNTYFDQYKFPYRSFLNPLPVSGNDFLINADWRAEKGFVINLKIKNEIKGDIVTVIDSIQRDVKLTDNRHQFNARLGFIYQLSDALRFRSRFEFVNVRYRESGNASKGSLFFSDMRLNPFPGLVFDMRIIFFDTENYDSRIYEYENDIKGVMSNTALYGKGKRWYAVLRYKPFRLFEISAKYSETYTDGVKFTGSGNDRIDGDINNRLNIGVEILF